MAALKQRGAVFTDFPAQLDEYIARLPSLSSEEVSNTFAKFKRFYFDHVEDPHREFAFLERLASR
jgi:hypothetical protein